LPTSKESDVILRQLRSITLLHPVIDDGAVGHPPLVAALLESVEIAAAQNDLPIR